MAGNYTQDRVENAMETDEYFFTGVTFNDMLHCRKSYWLMVTSVICLTFRCNR